MRLPSYLLVVSALLLVASSGNAQQATGLPMAPAGTTSSPAAAAPPVNLPSAAPSPVAAAPVAAAPTAKPPAATAAATPNQGKVRESEPPLPTSEAAIAPGDASQDSPESPNKEGIPGFSFGDVQNSLFFTSRQIDTMKTVLQAAESHHPDSGGAAVAVQVPEDILPFNVAPKPIEEPNPYPVFYLSSVVFHTTEDWTVWLNGKRVTPKNNHGELEVSAIAPDMVTFNWRPPYLQALVKRQEGNKFAPLTDVKHRLTASDNVVFDEKRGLVTFTLRPNQSFAVGYMNTFEGRVGSPTLPSIQADPALKDSSGRIGDATAKMTDSVKAVLNDMGGGGGGQQPAGGAQPGASPQLDSNTINTLKNIIKNQEQGFTVTPHPPSGPPDNTPPGVGMSTGIPNN